MLTEGGKTPPETEALELPSSPEQGLSPIQTPACWQGTAQRGLLTCWGRELRDARLPMRLTPCSSALLWAEGGPTATSGRMQRLHPSAFMPFFLLVVGKLQQGGLGKD